VDAAHIEDVCAIVRAKNGTPELAATVPQMARDDVRSLDLPHGRQHESGDMRKVGRVTAPAGSGAFVRRGR
jgi:hypothetical protein